MSRQRARPLAPLTKCDHRLNYERGVGGRHRNGDERDFDNAAKISGDAKSNIIAIDGGALQ